MSRYVNDWPVQILQRARVVTSNAGVSACEACGWRLRHRDRYCFQCGRTLDWSRRG